MNQTNQDIIDSEFSEESFLNELNKYPIVLLSINYIPFCLTYLFR